MSKSVTAIVFPFDHFGSEGSGAGAQLLGDVLHEAINDEELELHETRPRCFTRSLTVEEVGFTNLDQLQNWQRTGENVSREFLKKNFLIWLSGNHLGVLPVLDVLGTDTLVLQLDAHLDIQSFHDTTSELSHGNFMRHRNSPGPAICHVGHRDLFTMPADIEEHFETVISAEELHTNFAKCQKAIQSQCRKAKRLWIDLDVDVLDPVFAPGVHTPLPFGLTPPQLMNLVNAVWCDKIAGVSISEFMPSCDEKDRTLNLLGWFLEWLLLKQAES